MGLGYPSSLPWYQARHAVFLLLPAVSSSMGIDLCACRLHNASTTWKWAESMKKRGGVTKENRTEGQSCCCCFHEVDVDFIDFGCRRGALSTPPSLLLFFWSCGGLQGWVSVKPHTHTHQQRCSISHARPPPYLSRDCDSFHLSFLVLVFSAAVPPRSPPNMWAVIHTNIYIYIYVLKV